MKKFFVLFIISILFLGNIVFAGEPVILKKRSGDKQYGLVDSKTHDTLVVQAVNNKNQPVSGIKVVFNLALQPKKNKSCEIVKKIGYTNENGIAATDIIFGTKPGKYIISATSPQSDEAVFFNLVSNSQTWLVFIFFGLLGGLGLFLYGMDFMGDGLQKWAGDQMRSILGSLTRNRVMGLFLGLFVTAIIQSSSATTVMLVGFTNAGLMTLQQTIGVILGADIGTTVTAQLVAFKLTKFALMFIGIGFIIWFLGKTQKQKYIGQVIMGFGILFFGMKVMSDTLKPLRDMPFFINMLATMKNPLLALLISTAFTSIIQSSSATTGVIITLSLQGVLDLEMAIPLIFGANIGTCITAGLASIGASREAKQVAVAHVTFKLVGVAIFFWLMSPLASIVRWICIHSTHATAATVNDVEFVPRQIANAHMVFNVLMALLFIPFTHYFAKAVERILPRKKEEEELYRPKYIDRNLLTFESPTLALLQTKKEVLRMAKTINYMLTKCEQVLSNKKKEELDELIAVDEKVDILYKEIKPFLGLIIQEELNKNDSVFFTEIAYVAEELETMGDIISKSLAGTIDKVITKEIYFHEADWEHIVDFYRRVKTNLKQVIEAFEKNKYSLAEKALAERSHLQVLYKTVQISHLQKYKAEFADTLKYSSEYLSILSDFRDLFYMSNNIAYAVMDYHKEKDYLPK